MDFAKFIKTIYEMGTVVITETRSNTKSDNNCKAIGKVDEYEFGIEIMFKDDANLWIDKSCITTIEYEDDKALLRFNNGDVILFENV